MLREGELMESSVQDGRVLRGVFHWRFFQHDGCDERTLEL